MTDRLPVQRRQRAAALCAAHNLKHLVIYGNAWRCDYLRYLTDFAIQEGHGFAVFDGHAVRLFLEQAGEVERAQLEAEGVEAIHLSPFFESLPAVLAGLGSATGVAPIDLVPWGMQQHLPAGFVDVSKAYETLLMEKLEDEIAAVRRAAAIADEGYEVFCHAARPGRMEYELVADVEGFFRGRGCPDNFMIVGSGGTEVRSMHPPGKRRIEAGDLVTTELTPCIDGYYAQLCRTLVVGPASAVQQAAFEVYLEAMEAGLAAVRPGVRAGDVARVENDVFRKHGLGQYTTNEYTRVRGHGLGLYVDSRPALLEDTDLALAENMTIIVHPNTYNPHAGYIVLGDTVVVRAAGPELLTGTARKLFSVAA